MGFEDLRSVRQVTQANPAFTESSIRWLIFNRQRNGFGEVLVKLGRRLLIDVRKLDKWIDEHRVEGKQ